MQVPSTQHNDFVFLYITKWSQCLVTLQSFYIIGYIPHAAHFISMIHLFCLTCFTDLPYHLPSGNYTFIFCV